MATHSSILAWKISWTEKPGGLQSTGSQKNRTWLKWLSTHSEFYHRLWWKSWEGNGKRKEKIRVRITEREVVGNCTKCCGIGSLRRKHLRRDMKGRKWPSNRVSAGAWGRSHASFGQTNIGRRGRLCVPKGSVSFRRPVSSLPPLASIFPCQPDSIGIKTEVLNVFKSPSLLHTLLLSEITFIYPMGMSPGGWSTPLPPVPQVAPCDPVYALPSPSPSPPRDSSRSQQGTWGPHIQRKPLLSTHLTHQKEFLSWKQSSRFSGPYIPPRPLRSWLLGS